MKKRYNWINHLLNFLAVILGVYLAFYVNERAKRSEAKKELSLLVSAMVNDLEADIRAYEGYHIPINQDSKALIDTLILLMAQKDISAIEIRLAGAIQLENYVPNNTVLLRVKRYAVRREDRRAGQPRQNFRASMGAELSPPTVQYTLMKLDLHGSHLQT
ncbi:MAG: hypothetical protein AAF242_11455 [Bacteroidota bacterium]